MVDVGLFGVTVVEPLVDPEPAVVPPVVDVLPVVVAVLVEEVLELVAVSAAVAGTEAVDEVDAVDPESSPPQPASAMVTLLNSAGQTTRPTRLTFFMRPRRNDFGVRPGRTKSLIRGGAREHAAVLGACCLISRDGLLPSRQPRCRRLFVPLDRKLCVPGFHRVCS